MKNESACYRFRRSLASAALASGFQHMGQLAMEGPTIFVSDNVAGVLFKVDRSSGQVSKFVDRIHDYAGGLLAVGNGQFLATRQSADMTDGRLYRICPMTTTLGAIPSIGSSLVLDMESAHFFDRETGRSLLYGDDGE